MSALPGIMLTAADVAAGVASLLPAEFVERVLREEARAVADVVPLVDAAGNEGLALLQAPNVARAKAIARQNGVPVRYLGRKKPYILRSELRAALVRPGRAPGPVQFARLDCEGETTGDGVDCAGVVTSAGAVPGGTPQVLSTVGPMVPWAVSGGSAVGVNFSGPEGSEAGCSLSGEISTTGVVKCGRAFAPGKTSRTGGAR